jgi:hypothetical protein
MAAGLILLGTAGRAQPLVLRTRGLQTKEVELAKGPKDEDDPIQLRRFAKRIAEIKWWNDNSESEKPAGTQDQSEQPGSERPQATSEDREPPTSDEQQPTNDDGPSSEGETS